MMLSTQLRPVPLLKFIPPPGEGTSLGQGPVCCEVTLPIQGVTQISRSMTSV